MKHAIVACCLLVVGRSAAAAAEGARGIDPSTLSYTYTVGSFAPEYTPPAPGSYTLPVIKAVSDHPLVDSDAEPSTVFTLKSSHLAVVAFVYTTCTEAAGCPLSQAVMQRIDRSLALEPELASHVRLISISFDPERDTPARMKTVRGFFQPQTSWYFATTRDEGELQPLLDDFGQTVAKLYADGKWSGLFRHVLKVFVLDADNRIRNIYSAGFLNPQLVLNDLRTLHLEALAAQPGAR